MNIQTFNGGLGNQIMQYIFLRHCEIVYNEEVWADNTYFFWKQSHNGFELKTIFPNLNLKMLGDLFTEDVWSNMLELCSKSSNPVEIFNILYDNGLEFYVIADEWTWDSKDDKLNTKNDVLNQLKSKYYFKTTPMYVTGKFMAQHGSKVRPFKNKETGKSYENIYYAGVWQNELFGMQIKEVIESELEFPPLKHESNIHYMEKMLESNVAVGIHVRRGDFIDVGRSKELTDYSKVLRNVKRDLVKTNLIPTYFIFSDDLNYCKENIAILDIKDEHTIIFIEGNDVDARNYLDMQLMTYCDILIAHEKSSFSLSATIISKKKIKFYTV